MKKWPAKHSIFISRCFWDYYLHVFQKLYALELAAKPNSYVTWFDPPTRNPLTWLRERKRIINGVTVRRPFSLRNEYERFRAVDRFLFRIQLQSSLGKLQETDLWSIACSHPWLANKNLFSKSIYWPGDYFRPVEEFSDYENYDLVMPWTTKGIENIPSCFQGASFQSSTCAGQAFMDFDSSNPLSPRFDFSKNFQKTIVYIGGLSIGRIDFTLLHSLASNLPDHAILIGAKPDGHHETKAAIEKLIAQTNVFLFEDLNYAELANLTHAADACIIPYKTSGFNAGCCPNKLFEYAALGKPIISSPIPTVEQYAPLVSIAPDEKSFLRCVRVATADPPSEEEHSKLRTLAQEATPSATIQRIALILS
jgi:glycosyltransferase involved in cell wall biosynthesis